MLVLIPSFPPDLIGHMDRKQFRHWHPGQLTNESGLFA